MIAKGDQLLTELKRGRYRQIYVFGGEEPFVGDEALNHLADHVLGEGERDFNLSILYGKETDASSIASEAKRYPMMAEYTVVLVKEAQHVRDLDDLATYVEQSQPSTILAIALSGKKLDKRRALYKALKQAGEQAVYVETKAIADHQLPPWIANQARLLDLNISPKAAALMAESMGSKLSRVRMELEKYRGLLGAEGNVDADVVQRHTGISKTYNNFELIKALAAKDHPKVYRIAKSMARNSKEQPLVLTIGLLYSTFSKAYAYSSLINKQASHACKALNMSEWALRDVALVAQNYTQAKLQRIIGYLRTADGQSKGMGAPHLNDSSILHELLFKILA
ncbi:MAG: DNA polymerase III subunit delta [Schleiferiaceae bacterium]|nr:DNA polymerase III subunit delta [Schleiferiaceae bacterium]